MGGWRGKEGAASAADAEANARCLEEPAREIHKRQHAEPIHREEEDHRPCSPNLHQKSADQHEASSSVLQTARSGTGVAALVEASEA